MGHRGYCGTDLELGAGLAYLGSCAEPAFLGVMLVHPARDTPTNHNHQEAVENSSRDFTAAPLQNSCPKKGTAFVHLTSVSIPEIPCGMGQILHTDVGW